VEKFAPIWRCRSQAVTRRQREFIPENGLGAAFMKARFQLNSSHQTANQLAQPSPDSGIRQQIKGCADQQHQKSGFKFVHGAAPT
jgi:hypothetical protein